QLKYNMNSIKKVAEGVKDAVHESTMEIGSVAEVSVNLTASVGNISQEANSNMDIAVRLNDEVSKFKLS
ncbi:MAG: hypothetical protein K2N94_06910, partial [Lachnospiraceae bacterium]|nr:hypothetical protein [Lachnospiraceae bacterium]